MPQEVAVTNPRKRPDQHVLRVTRDGGHTANVRGGSYGQQIGQRGKFHPLGSAQDERNHHQADDVVDEECREEAAGENHRGQKQARFQTPQNRFRVPFEESHQMEVADDQHHRKEQDDGSEVDEVQRLARSHDAECDHGNGANDGGTRAVNLRSGKFT